MQGKTISGYTLQRLLGTGGMAEVWYAESKIGTKAAVKIMSEKLSHDDSMQERFLNEAKVMVLLDHPNIRKVYGFDEIDGRPAIVMEYLDGSDLKARMKGGQRFTQEELEKWWNQLADALNYTHSQDIIHRDIKPSNIFVDQRGNAKLLDFGIAKVVDTTTGTLTGTTLGTRIYMSPEQVRDPKRVGPPSDVYSLAVSFVHLLTGKAPYDSTTSSDYDIQESIVRKPLDMSKVPDTWRGFLLPYLEKDPAKRPALRPFEAAPPTGKPETSQTPSSGGFAIRPKGDGDLQSPADDEGTLVNNTPKKQESQRQGPKKTQPMAKTEPKVEGDKPKSKKGFWIGLGVAAVTAIAAFLFLRQPKPVSTDRDTEEFFACQTVADYRAYCDKYGTNAAHYTMARQKIDSFMFDSIQRIEAEDMALAIKDEEDAYKACNTIANCKAYLEKYPQGRHADLVRETLNGLEDDEAYAVCTTIAACDTYLRKYPQGRHVAEVRQKRNELATEVSLTGSANGHGWVDLGLPSGTLWATCNVGATNPEGYGSYFAWGEIEPKTYYYWNTYKYVHDSDRHKLTKYCNDSNSGNNGFSDMLTTLQSNDDPATKKWGSGWHTPTKKQWDELIQYTTNVWTTRNGVKGRLFRAENGQSIFLPAAGNRWYEELKSVGESCLYWSSSLSDESPEYACYLWSKSDFCYTSGDVRSIGRSIRPVRQR